MHGQFSDFYFPLHCVAFFFSFPAARFRHVLYLFLLIVWCVVCLLKFFVVFISFILFVAHSLWFGALHIWICRSERQKSTLWPLWKREKERNAKRTDIERDWRLNTDTGYTPPSPKQDRLVWCIKRINGQEWLIY